MGVEKRTMRRLIFFLREEIAFQSFDSFGAVGTAFRMAVGIWLAPFIPILFPFIATIVHLAETCLSSQVSKVSIAIFLVILLVAVIVHGVQRKILALGLNFLDPNLLVESNSASLFGGCRRLLWSRRGGGPRRLEEVFIK
jgi:hypothetical protein